MQRDTARLAASGANETAGPAPLEQERRAPRLVRKRFVKLGKRTPPRHRSFIPAIPHSRLDRSHTICSTYLSQRDKPSVALIYNWWSLFVRLADPEHHREAITARPLLLWAIAQRTQQAGQVTLTISSAHGMRDQARQAYLRIAGFLTWLRKSAEQLDPLQRWYRILSEALRHFLRGRQLQPPLR